MVASTGPVRSFDSNVNMDGYEVAIEAAIEMKISIRLTECLLGYANIHILQMTGLYLLHK